MAQPAVTAAKKVFGKFKFVSVHINLKIISEQES